MTPRIIFVLVAGLLASAAHGQSPTWAEMSGAVEPTPIRVTQYLDLADDSRLVILGAGAEEGVVAGSTFKTYRQSVGDGTGAGKIWVETGRLKAIEVQKTYTVAEVEQQGSQMSRAFFPKFSGVMASDLAVMQRLTLTRRQAVMPTIAISYFDLFDDPKASPSTFELMPDAAAKLRDSAAAFAGARLSVLMVEGYTDHHGSSSDNQIESYQRALTVRQFLIDELGFDAGRVVAVGYGEAEPADSSFAPGYIEANRRIVLKAVPITAR